MTRTYEYDTAGNLIYETGNNSSHYVDYQYNVLNQPVRMQVDKDKNVYTYEYDGRGNQVKELYGKNKKVTATGTYVYDETNKLTQGTNGAGEISLYTRDGMGNLVGNEWIVRKNAYGYHGFDDIEPSVPTTLKNHEVVKKDFVPDYTSERANVLLEKEEEGLTYRYSYGINEHRLSVKVSPIEQAAGAIMENGAVKLYYHTDYLGTTDYLTSDKTGKVTSWTMYNSRDAASYAPYSRCAVRFVNKSPSGSLDKKATSGEKSRTMRY